MTIKTPSHRFFPHSSPPYQPPPPLLPSRGEATPVSLGCGSLSIQSKCGCYFLSVTPICQGPCQGHTSSSTLPPVVPLPAFNVSGNMSASCRIIIISFPLFLCLQLLGADRTSCSFSAARSLMHSADLKSNKNLRVHSVLQFGSSLCFQ